MDGLLDFIGLPLFLYGIVTLLATHKSWIQWLLAPIVKPTGGRLGPLAVKHISLKPHRMVSFLLIVSLMASVSLYPTVTSRSFEEKAQRGARVQMGTDLQLIFNSPELADAEELHGELADQRRVLESGLMRILEAVRQVEGVRSVIYMLEAVLPHFYLPGHGLRGVPLYLIGNIDAYLQNVYAEPELGIGLSFEELVSQLGQGRAAVSPSVAEFWRISSQTPILMGMDTQRRSISVPASGVLAFLPGTPPLTITDRQGYVQARLDYLNHLFNSNAYLVAAADNPALSSLDVLIPRVIVLVGLAEGVSEGSLQEDILRALPVAPLELNNLTGEISKVGSDMFISLALANMRIYLVGGLLLALIAILAVAFANYVEDRRTLALLRIRGTSPKQIWRFFAATLFSPAFLGLALGILVALIAGYGLANYVWELREIQTAVQLLPSHLVVSPLTFWVALLIMSLILGVSWISSWWVFRKTAREDIQEG
ncbi:ABC transporter permease [Acidobacteria bacterium AH-259-D05]|nr:ABC transporter permease [Acidobacteria bacterium AH-259-D05]